MKRARDDKNFEPLYAEKSHSQAGLTIRQPFLTIPKYGHFGQKMDFPIDFIFQKHNFSERARDEKNFEPSYAKKSQVMADLTSKLSKNCNFRPKI